MNTKTLIAIALLGLGISAAAFGQGKVVSMAYEVNLSAFHAPATSNGSISFKECGDCTKYLVRVTEATRYSVNGKSVRLADFKEACLLANDRNSKSVTILHHLESDTIQSIDALL